MQETWARSLGQEDPLEKGMAAHSSILAWRIPWTEEPGRLQSMSSQKRQIWLSNNNIKVHINSKCERQVLNVNLHESQMHFSSTVLFSTSLIWQTQKKKLEKVIALTAWHSLHETLQFSQLGLLNSHLQTLSLSTWHHYSKSSRPTVGCLVFHIVNNSPGFLYLNKLNY